MNVVHFQRNPGNKCYSLETLFNTVRQYLPESIDCSVFISKYESRGVFKRIYNILEASFNQQHINHITGDIHFISYLMSGNKTILTVLDCVYEFNTSGIKRYLIWFFWYFLPLHRVSYVTVISEATKSRLTDLCRINPDKIIVIPCCVSPKYMYKPKPFNSQCPIILQVGSGNNKNIIRLAEALQGISCRLVIIGKLLSNQTEALLKYNILYSNYHTLTEDEVINKYIECDMVSFVSVYEGFGMPIIEANATGRPVVTSNLLSMPEVAGNAACIVDPYSVNEIRDGILKIITNETYRNQLIENGLNNVNRFTPISVSKQYSDLYHKLYNEYN